MRAFNRNDTPEFVGAVLVAISCLVDVDAGNLCLVLGNGNCELILIELGWLMVDDALWTSSERSLDEVEKCGMRNQNKR